MRLSTSSAASGYLAWRAHCAQLGQLQRGRQGRDRRRDITRRAQLPAIHHARASGVAHVVLAVSQGRDRADRLAQTGGLVCPGRADFRFDCRGGISICAAIARVALCAGCRVRHGHTIGRAFAEGTDRRVTNSGRSGDVCGLGASGQG